MNKVSCKVLVAVAISAVIASPALAKSQHAQRPDAATQGQRAYAQEPSRYLGVSRHSSNPAYDVFRNGHYVGSDPDPFIRDKLFWESFEGRD